MKTGDYVNMLVPLPNIGDGKRVAVKEGKYMGWYNGNRIVLSDSGLRWEIPRGSPCRLTTKHVNISPCGLKE
mgnify:CR=1 FL=1